MSLIFLFFFFNDTATTEIYTLSLHDALPILLVNLFRNALEAMAQSSRRELTASNTPVADDMIEIAVSDTGSGIRSEEHTSELQSHLNLVCRLLLEKKKKSNTHSNIANHRLSS